MRTIQIQKNGRGGRTRTRDLRFWRPLPLCAVRPISEPLALCAKTAGAWTGGIIAVDTCCVTTYPLGHRSTGRREHQLERRHHSRVSCSAFSFSIGALANGVLPQGGTSGPLPASISLVVMICTRWKFFFQSSLS